MRKVELRIINSRLLIEDNLVDIGVAIEEGKIIKIAKEPHLPESDTTINGHNMLMIPGIVDAHVHMRDMELSYKEDFSSGTRAAAIGGVTTVLDMPNTLPPTISGERLKEKMRKATGLIYSNIGFFGGLALEPRETATMIDEGAVGIKLYLNDPQYGSLDDDKLLNAILKPIKSAGALLAVHAELPQKVTARHSLTNVKDEIDLFLRAHDPQMEISAVSKCIRIAQSLGIRLHLCHLSTEGALASVSKEKHDTQRLTTEVTPHHLLLTEEALYRFGSSAKMVPPLRMPSDAYSLFNGLVDGTVDIIASDHAPHTNEEKNTGFAEAPSGVPGLETMLPLVLTQMTKRRISLKRVIETMSENPSRLFGLKDIGRIEEGYNADLVLVDLKKTKKIDPNTFLSKAKYTPFEGLEVKGIPVLTLVNGVAVMRDGEIVGKPGDGRVIRISKDISSR